MATSEDGDDEQWSFDDSLDGLGDSLDVDEGDGGGNDEGQLASVGTMSTTTRTRGMNHHPLDTSSTTGTPSGAALMQDVPTGDDGAHDGWNDDDLGLLSFDDDGHGVGSDLVGDGATPIASDEAPLEPPPHPPATSSTTHTTAASTPHDSGISRQHANNRLNPTHDPSPGKAAATRVLGTGLHFLGAGLSATVAALAEPDEESCEDDADGGWDDDELDDRLSLGSDEDKDDVPTHLAENYVQNPYPLAPVTGPSAASNFISDGDEQYHPPPPPPFPTAALLLPTATRWGAAIAEAVAPVGDPRNVSARAASTPSAAEAAVEVPPDRTVGDSSTKSNSVKVGPGPFLGRLTKLIEDAAAPDHVEGRTLQEPPPPSPPLPPAVGLAKTAHVVAHSQQGQGHGLQYQIQSDDMLEDTADIHSGDGWGNSYDEFEFDEDSNDIGCRMDGDEAEFDPSQPSVHEPADGQSHDVILEHQEEPFKQTIQFVEGGETASFSEGVVTPHEPTGTPDASDLQREDDLTVPGISSPQLAKEHNTGDSDNKTVIDGVCTSVCRTACLAAVNGEVCKCVEQILVDSSGDDVRMSKVLKSETLRRILLEMKSEQDESVLASLTKTNSELTLALEKQTQRCHELSLDLQEAQHQEAERAAYQQTSSTAVEEEKRMWAERASSLEDEVRFLREQLDMVSASTTEADAMIAENASLRYELESKVSEHEELFRKSNKMDEYKSQAAESSKRAEGLVRENRLLQEKIDDLEASKSVVAEESAGHTKHLSETIASLQKNLDEKADQIEQDFLIIRDLESKLLSAEEKAPSLDYDDTESRRIALEDEMQSQRQELEVLRADRDSLRAELRERDVAYDQIESDLQDSKGSTARIQIQFDELADKMESMTRDHLEKLNENLSRLKELEDINSLLEQEKNNLEMDVVNMATTQEALDFIKTELDVTRVANTKLEAEAEGNKVLIASLESENSIFKEQVRSLQEPVSSASYCGNAVDPVHTEADELVGENKRLSEKCQELEQTIDRMQAEASMNEAEVSALEMEMEEATTQRDKLQSQYDALQSQQLSMSENHVATNEALASSRIEISSLSDRNQEFLSTITNLEEQLRQHADSLERAKAEAEQYIPEKEALENDKKVLVGKVQAMEEVLDQMRLTVDSQARKNVKSKRAIENVIAEKDAIIESLHSEVAQVISAREEAISRASAMEQERDVAVSGEEQTQRIIDERNDQVAKLQVDLESARSQYDDKSRDLERQLEVLDKELKDKAAVITALEEENLPRHLNAASVEEDTSSSIPGRAALEAEIAKLRTFVACLEGDLAASNEERDQLGKENEELFVQLGLLRDAQLANRGDSSRDSNEIQSEIQSMRHQIDELNVLYSERAHAIEQKDACITEMQIEIENLRRNVELGRDEENTAIAEEEMHQLRSLLASKDKKLKAHASEIAMMRSEVDGYRQELAEKEGMINRITETTCSVSASLRNMSSQETAENMEIMRNHIISLANAIQTAEISRAEALEVIVRDREDSAESLSKMAEHLKRFYSAVASTN